MGHGLNNTVQDVLVRWRRMCGDETLWLPGTDHAGIATQNVVEKQLATEGKTRFDLGREAFVARTVRFVEETGGTILAQLRAIGASRGLVAHGVHAFARAVARRARSLRAALRARADLSRASRDPLVSALPHVALRRGGGIPRDDRASCTTSRTRDSRDAGDEPRRDRRSRRHGLKRCWPMSQSRCIRTTHAIATWSGRTVSLPIANVEIPIIADTYADPAFGTGVGEDHAGA